MTVLGHAAVFTGPRKVGLKTFEIAPPAPGELLGEIIRANICGSELHIYLGHHPSLQPGTVLGHEGLARVLDPGQMTHDFRGAPLSAGDRIVATYFRCCRRCVPCQRGLFNLCQFAYSHWTRPASEHPHFHGTLGTHYMIGPDQYIYRVPESISDKAAAAANCALSQMLFGLEEAGLGVSSTVLIQGAGGLGLCGAAVAAASGAQVVVVDREANRLREAERFGATDTVKLNPDWTADEQREAVMAALDGEGAEIVADVTGSPTAFASAFRVIAPGGTVLSIGNVNPGQFCEFDPGAFTRSGVRVLGVMRYQPWFLGRALDFLSRHPTFPWDDLLDRDYALEDIGEALADSAARRVTRASVVP